MIVAMHLPHLLPSFRTSPHGLGLRIVPKLALNSWYVVWLVPASDRGPDLINRLKQKVGEKDTDVISHELRPLTTMASFPTSTFT